MEREAQVGISLSGLTLAHATDEQLYFTVDDGYLALRIEADEIDWSRVDDTRRGELCRLTEEPAGELTHYRLFVDSDIPTWEARCEGLIAHVGEATEVFGFMLVDDTRVRVIEAIRAVVEHDREAVAGMGGDPDGFWEWAGGQELELPSGRFEDWPISGFPDNGGLYLHVEFMTTDLTLRLTLREDGVELHDLHVM